MNYSQIICKDERLCNDRCRSRTAATSKMERFVIIANGFHPLTIITKPSILIDAAVLDPLWIGMEGFKFPLWRSKVFGSVWKNRQANATWKLHKYCCKSKAGHQQKNVWRITFFCLKLVIRTSCFSRFFSFSFTPFSTNISLGFLLAKCLKNTCGRVEF